ncbi:DUF2512 family protein [Clostridium malenominatum]|uniref:DUF2512 family protein n=1 Tax=Clostridium malenominatum TaxID=1539 RepID=A0ABP3U7S8_9CLOT
MKHVSALIIKFLIVAVVLEVVLGMMTNLSFISILYIAAVVTALAYILGDIILLDISNNLVTTISDMGLALVTIFMFNYWWKFRSIPFTAAFLSAILIGIGEWFFHEFVHRNVLPEDV